MGNRFLYSLFLIYLFAQPVYAWQEDPVKQINQALYNSARYFPREKIYLQFNGDHYTPGSIVQFSGVLYCQSAPSSLSRIVYVELADSSGRILNRIKLPVDSARFTGSFRLPPGVHGSSWFLRAYTAWMLNFDPACFYYHTLRTSPVPAETLSTIPDSGFRVYFFPEGGQLVERLTSRIAFRAVGSNGLPIDISGKIVDSSGQLLANIGSKQFGIGSFLLHTSPRKKYYALVTANGILKRIPLPVPAKSGISVYVQNKFDGVHDSVFFHLSRSVYEKEKYRDLLLCATMDTHRFFQKIQFDENTAGDPVDTLLEAETWLPLDSFPEGVVHLAVFDKNAGVLAERIFFHHRAEDRFTGPGPESAGTTRRFVFHAVDSWRGRISIHAEKDILRVYENENIYSALMLTPEIRENLFHPGWYFLQKKERAPLLDLQLLTVKETFFSWYRILHEQIPVVHFQPEQGVFLRGEAFQESGNSKTALKNGLLFLLLKTATDSSVQPLSVTTDSSGKFLLALPGFQDTATVYIQTGKTGDNRKKENISIRFDNSNRDSAQAPQFKPWDHWLKKTFPRDIAISNQEILSAVPEKQLPDTPGVKLLKAAEVKGKLPTHLDSVMAEYTTGIFSNPNSWAQTIDFTNNKDVEMMDYQSVFEYLRNKVKGIEYIYDRDEDIYIAVWRMGSSSFNPQLTVVEKYKSNAPAYFIDENLINSTYYEYNNAYAVLISIPVSRVALIRVYQPGSLPNVPGNAPHGAFSIYLKHGNELRNAGVSSATFNRVNLYGYTKPERDSLNRSAGKGKDSYRWKPEVYLDNIHKEFSLDADPGEEGIDCVAEGMDDFGRIAGIYRGRF